MANMTESERADLETEFVDKFGLSAVLAALSIIASEKAEHLRSNWQDRAAAKSWERDSNKLDQIRTDN